MAAEFFSIPNATNGDFTYVEMQVERGENTPRAEDVKKVI